MAVVSDRIACNEEMESKDCLSCEIDDDDTDNEEGKGVVCELLPCFT